MDKNYDIIKIITHADGGEEYSKNVSEYPSNEDSVAVRGYGVDANDPENAQKQFDTMAKYHGNEGKNQYIQFMMSFLKDTAPDAETAMSIADKVVEPLKDEHQIYIGIHKKQRGDSDYHAHDFVGTTNMKTGRLLHSNNKLNFTMAQNCADAIGKPVQLVIEKKNKKKEPETNDTPTEENNAQSENSNGQSGGKKKNDDFTRIFYPHNTSND